MRGFRSRLFTFGGRRSKTAAAFLFLLFLLEAAALASAKPRDKATAAPSASGNKKNAREGKSAEGDNEMDDHEMVRYPSVPELEQGVWVVINVERPKTLGQRLRWYTKPVRFTKLVRGSLQVYRMTCRINQDDDRMKQCHARAANNLRRAGVRTPVNRCTYEIAEEQKTWILNHFSKNREQPLCSSKEYGDISLFINCLPLTGWDNRNSKCHGGVRPPFHPALALRYQHRTVKVEYVPRFGGEQLTSRKIYLPNVAAPVCGDVFISWSGRATLTNVDSQAAALVEEREMESWKEGHSKPTARGSKSEPQILMSCLSQPVRLANESSGVFSDGVIEGSWELKWEDGPGQAASFHVEQSPYISQTFYVKEGTTVNFEVLQVPEMLPFAPVPPPKERVWAKAPLRRIPRGQLLVIRLSFAELALNQREDSKLVDGRAQLTTITCFDGVTYTMFVECIEEMVKNSSLIAHEVYVVSDKPKRFWKFIHVVKQIGLGEEIKGLIPHHSTWTFVLEGKQTAKSLWFPGESLYIGGMVESALLESTFNPALLDTYAQVPAAKITVWLPNGTNAICDGLVEATFMSRLSDLAFSKVEIVELHHEGEWQTVLPLDKSMSVKLDVLERSIVYEESGKVQPIPLEWTAIKISRKDPKRKTPAVEYVTCPGQAEIVMKSLAASYIILSWDHKLQIHVPLFTDYIADAP